MKKIKWEHILLFFLELLVYCIVDIWLNIYSYYSRFMLK